MCNPGHLFEKDLKKANKKSEDKMTIQYLDSLGNFDDKACKLFVFLLLMVVVLFICKRI